MRLRASCPCSACQQPRLAPSPGLTQYSGEPQTEWDLNTFHTKEEVLAAVHSLRYKGGSTFTGVSPPSGVCPEAARGAGPSEAAHPSCGSASLTPPGPTRWRVASRVLSGAEPAPALFLCRGWFLSATTESEWLRVETEAAGRGGQGAWSGLAGSSLLGGASPTAQPPPCSLCPGASPLGLLGAWCLGGERRRCPVLWTPQPARPRLSMGPAGWRSGRGGRALGGVPGAT